jgi:YebC/PmpR family DNA-binding regulatory protein
MVDCMTDNRNRTVAEVRHAFSKCGGNLGTDGSVAYLFDKKGVLSYPEGLDEERIMEAALEAGAEDVVVNDDGSMEVLTSPDEYETVREAMTEAGFKPERGEVTMRAATASSLDVDSAQQVLKLLDMLDDLDDVQNIYTNADFPDEVMQGMS